MLTLVLVAAVGGPLSHHFAMHRRRFSSAPAATWLTWHMPLRVAQGGILEARRATFDDRPPARPFRTSFLSGDPMARYRAVTGVKARVRWWQRLLSLVGLAVLVVVMGALVAGVFGLLFFAARIVLELLVS